MFDHGEDIVGKYDVGMLEFSFSFGWRLLVQYLYAEWRKERHQFSRGSHRLLLFIGVQRDTTRTHARTSRRQ